MAARQFEIVPDDRPDPGGSPVETQKPPNPPTKGAQAALIASLMLALKAISQRAFIALLDTFSLITAGSVFWLFYSFNNPTIFQIVHATLYALFVLAINITIRRQI